MSRIVPLLALAALAHAAPVPFLSKPEKPAKYDNWFDHWDDPRPNAPTRSAGRQKP